LSSTFDFFGDIKDDKAVVAVFLVVSLVSELEVSFSASVAPGIDDNEVPVDTFVNDAGTTGDKGSSVSLGKLSVYNTLAELLNTFNQVNKLSIGEKRENKTKHYLFSTP
jgi:hypothetical protein